jgi:hypothetical protein
MMGNQRGRLGVLAVVIVLGAAVLVAASGGLAGSGPPTDSAYVFSAQPRFVDGGSSVLLAGKFQPPSGAGFGSATHVAFSFDAPTVFVPVSLPAACSGTPDATYPVPSGSTRYTCQRGTVNAGELAAQLLRFTAPAAQNPNVTYTFRGYVTFDNGSGGAGGGGSVNTLPQGGPATGLVTVVEEGHSSRDGECKPGTATAATPPVSQTDEMQSSVTGSSSLLCTWAFVGENSAVGGLLTPVSFVGFPQTAPGSPAVWTWEINKLPTGKKVEDLTLYFLPNYSPDNLDPTKTPMVKCVDNLPPTGVFELPSGQEACYITFVKKGSGAVATMLFDGGGDPGSGAG